MRYLLFLLFLIPAAHAQVAPGLPADTLVCNPTGAVGPPTNCTLGTNLSFSSNVLNATGGGGSGTVTSASVVSANGFSGTVATATTTPAITLQTSVTGPLKGAANALAAASASDLYNLFSGTPSSTCYLSGSGACSVPAGSVASVTGSSGVTTNPTTGAVAVSLYQTINAQSGTSYTIQATDAASLVTFNNASAVAVTLPVATTTGFGVGFGFGIQNDGAGTVTLTPTTSTLLGAPTSTSMAIAQYYGCWFSSNGTNYQVDSCTPIIPNAGTAFSGLTAGTNTTAAMLVGTGASLGISGSGTISATALTGTPNITVGSVNSNAGLTLTNAANSYTQTSTGLSLTSGTTGFGRNITGTVNDASAVLGILDFANVTCTTCTATSYLVLWEVGGTSELSLSTSGVLSVNSNISTNGGYIQTYGSGSFQWNARGILTSPAAGNIQLGAGNTTSPVAQTLSMQGVSGVANTAGANDVIQGSLGTGNAAGATLSLSTAHTGTSGSGAQTANTQIVMGDNTVSMPNLASSSSAATGTVCWTTGGNLTVDTTLACLSSTGRIKQDVQDLDEGLSTVMALRPVSYDLKPEFNPKALGPQVGLIAEDVQKVDPRLIGLDTEGQPLGVRYMQLTAVLVKAIQEQQAEINELKAAARRTK